MPRLILNPGSPSAREIELRPGANSLGRGFANDFKIEDPSVSASHCQIIVSDNGVLIKDLGSTNGTYVNRTPVSEAALQGGQTIHLGGVEMLYYPESPTTPPVAFNLSSPPKTFVARPTASTASTPESSPTAFVSPPSGAPAAATTVTTSQFCKFHPKTIGRHL